MRERNQLHAGRRVGIESWKLAAARGKRQWKRLRAVSEEVTAGQKVGSVEAVVDFRNHRIEAIVGRRDYRSIGTGIPSEIRRRPGMKRNELLNYRIACVIRAQ